MKNDTSMRYPNSAVLFQFCRRVLDQKFGGARVIDQDVGQILGFDPADCSHWKKGKKNIRSIQAIKAIAEHLGVDEKLVVDVACGEIDDHEALFEYNGYGGLVIERDLMETAKKEYYSRNASSWTREKEMELRDFFDLNEERIDGIVAEIHKKISYDEAPLYLPEIASAYPALALSADDSSDVVSSKFTEDKQGFSIHFPTSEKMRPYIRYQISREMASYFFHQDNLVAPKQLGEFADHLREVQSNLFATKLLAPTALMRKELGQVDIAKDIISQMADIFWVSKAFMNRRLKEILEQPNKTT